MTGKFPELHLRLMIICNNGNEHQFNKQHFYVMKHALLEQFGTKDGYDVQVIIKKCYSCKDGIYNHWEDEEYHEVCWNCNGSGIYSNTIWKLNRFKINDYLFHVPDGRLHDLKGLKYKNEIIGVIKHSPTKHNPQFAFLILLFFYDRIGFYTAFKNYTYSLRTNAKFKWKNCMKAAGNTLNGMLKYFGVNREEFPELEDDLPF